MAYDSYKLANQSSSSVKDEMLAMKKKQIEYLFKHSIDRESNCKLNGKYFKEDPRIFDVKIKTNYFKSLTCETIVGDDYFKSGDLLTYDNSDWICTSTINFHNLYCKGEFIKSNYTCYWQNDNLDIVSERCYVISATQYNNGEKGNKTLTLASDQYMVIMPATEETLNVPNTLRVEISRSEKYHTVYRCTRNDTVPFSDWDEGCVCLIFTRAELDKENDKFVEVDGKKVLICDYKEKNVVDDEPDGSGWYMKVTCNNTTIKPTGENKTITAQMYDSTGKAIDDEITYEWELTSNSSDYITSSADGKTCTLSLSTVCEEFGDTITVKCKSKYTGQSDSVTLTIKEVF